MEVQPDREETRRFEEWAADPNELQEHEAITDVFYDFFLGVPSIRTKRKFNKQKKDLIDKFKDISESDEKKAAYPEFTKEVRAAEDYGKIENQIEMARMGVKMELDMEGKLLRRTHLRVNGCRWQDMDEIQQDNHIKTLEKEKEKAVKIMTHGLKKVMRNKISVMGVLDTFVTRFAYCFFVNVVVIFMIAIIMNTITSEGLPGRQNIGETTAFRVVLKADRTKDAKARFTNPEGITDVCQGLGWWMDDPIFGKVDFKMPSGEDLRTLTKKHWDKNLNKDYTCPHIRQGLETELDVPGKPSTNPKCELLADPESVMWKGNRETGSFFLFQDQRHTSYRYADLIAGAEVYHSKGKTLTLGTETKEFTTMNGNYNGKVQTLQPMTPLDPSKAPFTFNVLGAGSAGGYSFKTFWVALDRIWPSEWTVQALFTVGWNDRQFDENKIVGGYNDFGRRPTTIVKASGHEHDGEMIEEAIWQYLERSCKHHYTTPNSKVKAAYTGKNKYDKNLGLKWEDLDQDVRDWWRALGLGVQRETCLEADTRVTVNNACIGDKVGCKRVNYHTVQRWHQYNDEILAAKNFNARNFASIFFSYSCEKENGDGAAPYFALSTTKLAVPSKNRMDWDAVDLADDGKIKEAATQLGYDQEEWDRHRADPTSAPPDNLVLEMENYLEGEAYWSSFFWTQIVCAMIMISVSLIEIRHIFLWYHLTRGPKSAWPIVLVKAKKPDHVQPSRWHNAPHCGCGKEDSMVAVSSAPGFWSCNCKRKCWNWFHFGDRWQCLACNNNFCFECKEGKEPYWFEWNFSTAVGIRVVSFFLSVISYVVIPVLVIEVSILLILESANTLDVIKDTLALLFLLEINNFLQIRSTPSAGKWKINMKDSALKKMSRHKNLFTLMMFAALAVLAWVTTVLVHTGLTGSTNALTGRFHPSIIFNPWRDRPVDLDPVPRWLCVFLIGLVFFVFFLSFAGGAFYDLISSFSIWDGKLDYYLEPPLSCSSKMLKVLANIEYLKIRRDENATHSDDAGFLTWLWMVFTSYEVPFKQAGENVKEGCGLSGGGLSRLNENHAQPDGAIGLRWKDIGPEPPTSSTTSGFDEIIDVELSKALYDRACAGKFLEFNEKEWNYQTTLSKIEPNSYIKVGTGNTMKYFQPAEGMFRRYYPPLRLLWWVYKSDPGKQSDNGFWSWRGRFTIWLSEKLDPAEEMDDEYFDGSEGSDIEESEDEASEDAKPAGQNTVGQWVQQYNRNGQLVEVLVNMDDKNILAQRRVGDPSTFTGHAGDTSGFGQWSVRDPVAPQFSNQPGRQGFPGVLGFAGSMAPQPVANMMYASPSAVPSFQSRV